MTEDFKPEAVQSIPGSPDHTKKPVNMIKILLIMNVVLIVAMGALYYLLFHRTAGTDANQAKDEIRKITGKTKPSAVVFVSTDSIYKNYKLVKELQDNFEKEYLQMEATLKARNQSFENEYKEYMKKAQSNAITADEAQAEEKTLAQKQQQLQQMNQDFSSQINEKDIQLKMTINDSINSFLKRYYKDKYDYILGYSIAGSILYAHEKNDITADVLKAMNMEYDLEKSSRKK